MIEIDLKKVKSPCCREKLIKNNGETYRVVWGQEYLCKWCGCPVSHDDIIDKITKDQEKG